MKAKVCPRCRKIVDKDHTCGVVIEARQSANERGYTSRWREFREQLFRKRAKKGVTCAMCKRAFGGEGFHADHIVPVQSADDPLFYEESNIQFLHPACHSIKTAQDVDAGATRSHFPP